MTAGDNVDTLTGIETLTLGGSQAGDTFDASGATSALTITLATGKISGLASNATNAIKSFTGFENANGGSGNDKISAGDTTSKAVANEISGGTGNDSLDGGFGADTLDGGAGADTLVGGAGDDYFYGGDGNDKLMDKLGNDHYAPLSADASEAASFGTDTIVDLAGTEDVLDMSLWGADDVTFDIVDGGTDKDTKLDALKITTSEGVIIIDGYFNNSLANDDGMEASDLIKGAGCIETIMIGSATFDFDAIKEALTDVGGSV
jgi:Ca2+-binding RTX toxin-like protein